MHLHFFDDSKLSGDAQIESTKLVIKWYTLWDLFKSYLCHHFLTLSAVSLNKPRVLSFFFYLAGLFRAGSPLRLPPPLSPFDFSSTAGLLGFCFLFFVLFSFFLSKLPTCQLHLQIPVRLSVKSGRATWRRKWGKSGRSFKATIMLPW